MTFHDGKQAFPNKDVAVQSITTPGKYRISEVTEHGRRDLKQFDVKELGEDRSMTYYED